MKLSYLKVNPKNPQKFSDLNKLKASVKDFPKMFKYRPIVHDENGIVLGGNKRLICLQELGFKEIPSEWAICAKDLSDDERKRFIIADNVGFGEWDWCILGEDYDIEELNDWGLSDTSINNDDCIEIPQNDNLLDENFIDDFESFNDTNCTNPIVPEFYEKHECFIIVVNNEIDEQYIRDKFNLNANHVSTSGDGKVRKTNVMSIENVKNALND